MTKIIVIDRKDISDRVTINQLLAAGFSLKVVR